jgi:hypothetical protein
MSDDLDLCAFPARRKAKRYTANPLPHRPMPIDRYWWLRETAKFDRWWHDNMEMPMLRLMAERIDQMWSEVK